MNELCRKMNPYEPNFVEPQTLTETDSSTSVAPIKRFRKRVIPATISYLIGGLLLVAFSFSIYNNWGNLTLNFDDPWPWFLLDVVMLSIFPSLLLIGLCYILAGKQWIKGRWILAVSLNVLPCLVMWLIITSAGFLRDWAFNSL